MNKKQQYRELMLKARAIAVAAEQESRGFTAEEQAKVAQLMSEAKAVKAELEQEAKDRAVIDEVNAFFASDGEDQGHGGQAAKGRTMGEQFVNSPDFQSWLKQKSVNGYIPDSVKGLSSPPIQFKSLLAGRKALVTGDSDTSAGAFVQTDYTGSYEPLGRQPLTLRQLVSPGQTTSDTVHFVRQTTAVQQAAPVAEANVTDYSGATGEVSGEKPEGTLAFVPVTENVKTIAVWIPATKRALSDAAQIRTIIDQELRSDLEEELEDQMLNGDGVGENFTGILNTTGILTQDWDTDLLTTTRKAKTTVRTTGRSTPSAWLINPSDWETIDLLQDDQGRYYHGGPFAAGPQTLWGIPVVETETIDEGTALLGDFRKATLWDREQASISISDSHADFFIRNMIAILAEMRAAFGVRRPTGFVSVDMTSGS